MKPNDFGKLLDEVHACLRQLTRTKGAEYRGQDRDQLHNFRDVATNAGIRPEQAWLVFYEKHANAIRHYVRTGAVLSEPIEGRILDAILYLVLLLALTRDKPRSPDGGAK